MFLVLHVIWLNKDDNDNEPVGSIDRFLIFDRKVLVFIPHCTIQDQVMREIL